MSLREPIVGGGTLVRVEGGSGLAVDGVPGSRRGLVVQSAREHADGEQRRAGRYRLTRRCVVGTDLWRVRRIESRPWICLRLDGSQTEHASLDAARRAARSSSGPRTVVETRRADATLPHPNDAAGWGALRLKRGLSGDR